MSEREITDGTIRMAYSVGGPPPSDGEKYPGMSRNMFTVDLFNADGDLVASATMPAELAIHGIIGNYNVACRVTDVQS